MNTRFIVTVAALIAFCAACDRPSVQEPDEIDNARPEIEQAAESRMRVLETANERLSLENKALKEENERLMRERRERMNEAKSARREKDDLIKTVRMMTAEHREREETLEQQVEELEKSGTELAKDRDEFEEQIEMMKQKIDDLSALEKELADIKAERVQLKQKIAELSVNEIVEDTGFPAQSRFHYNRGVAAFDSGRWRNSIREFKAALEVNPDDAESHFNLGVIYDTVRNDRARAIKHYLRYLELVPDAPDADKIRTHVASLYARHRVWGGRTARNLDESLWPGRW